MANDVQCSISFLISGTTLNNELMAATGAVGLLHSALQPVHVHCIFFSLLAAVAVASLKQNRSKHIG